MEAVPDIVKVVCVATCKHNAKYTATHNILFKRNFIGENEKEIPVFGDIFAMCTLVLMVRESRESGLRAEIDRKKALYEAQGAKICELTAEPFPPVSVNLSTVL